MTGLKQYDFGGGEGEEEEEEMDFEKFCGLLKKNGGKIIELPQVFIVFCFLVFVLCFVFCVLCFVFFVFCVFVAFLFFYSLFFFSQKYQTEDSFFCRPPLTIQNSRRRWYSLSHSPLSNPYAH